MEDNNQDKLSFFKKRKKSLLFTLATLLLTLAVSLGIVFGISSSDNGLGSISVKKVESDTIMRIDNNEDRTSDIDLDTTLLSRKFVSSFTVSFKIIFPNSEEQKITFSVPMSENNGYKGVQKGSKKINNIDREIIYDITINTRENSNKFSYALTINELPKDYDISQPDIFTQDKRIQFKPGETIDLTDQLFDEKNEKSKIEKEEGQNYFDFTPENYNPAEFNTKRLQITFEPDYLPGSQITLGNTVPYLFYPKNPAVLSLENYGDLAIDSVLTIDNPFIVRSDGEEVRSQLILTFDSSTKGDEEDSSFFTKGIRITKVEYKKISPLALEISSFNITVELTEHD